MAKTFKGRLLDQFCFTCGHQLRGLNKINYYDELTGKPIYFTDINCPNRSWFLFGRMKYEAHPATKSEGYIYG